MKQKLHCGQITTVLMFIALVNLAVSGCSGTRPAAGPEPSDGQPWPSPVNPNPAASSLQPGLTVRYAPGTIRNKTDMRHIGGMPDVQSMEENGIAGKPITRLAHRAGRGAEVFNSGTDRLVWIQMRGMIQFARTGEYSLKAESNDGIRIFLGERLIINDPDQHGDRMSPPAIIDVQAPGWYPLLIRYFQRKGTSALLLYWKKPGDSGFEIVPAEALAHGP